MFGNFLRNTILLDKVSYGNFPLGNFPLARFPFGSLPFYSLSRDLYKYLLLIFALSITISSQAAPIHLTKLEIPQRAPNFSLIDLDNKTHTLNHFIGKPLIVNFWATWCPPCLAELPSFNRAWAKVKDQGVNMIAVNIGESPNTVFNFIQGHPINFKILLDQESDELNNWQMQGLPTTYVLNYKGEVVYQAIGEREWDNDELLTKVLALRKP